MLGAAGPYVGITKKTLYTNMIMIDNVLGVGPTLTITDGMNEKTEGVEAEFSNNKVFGDSEIPDCPQNG